MSLLIDVSYPLSHPPSLIHSLTPLLARLGLTPLLTCIACNNYDLAKLLVVKQCDLEATTERPDTR